VGNVSSHIVDCRYGQEPISLVLASTPEGILGLTLVLVICSRRGDRMRDTKEVENSISSIAMLPSLVSKHFEKGSVVKMRKPRDVPVLVRQSSSEPEVNLPTARWL
jgi:hypothetical protein